MAGGVDEANAGLDLIAVLGFDDIGVRVNHQAGPLRRGPVIAVRLAGVLALPGVQHQGCMVEDIEVLVVVPVGVAHDNDVDVLGGEAALREGVHQEDAAANVAHVYQRALLSGDQYHAAPRRESGFGREVGAGEDDVDLRHVWGLRGKYAALGKWG